MVVAVLSLRGLIAAIAIVVLLSIVLPVLIFGIGSNESDKENSPTAVALTAR